MGRKKTDASARPVPPARGAPSPRRREVRRQLARDQRLFRGLGRRTARFWPILLACGLVLVGTMLAWVGRERPTLQVGARLGRPMVARVAFEAVDERKTSRLRQDAYARAPAVYAPNESFLSSLRDRLMALARFAEGGKAIPDGTREALALDAATLEALRRRIEKRGPDAWRSLVRRFISEGVASMAILEGPRAREERSPTQRSPWIVIRTPDGETRRRNDRAVFSASGGHEAIAANLRAFLAGKVEPPIAETMVAAVMSDLEPTYRLDRPATTRRKQAAANAQEPARMTYDEGDVLVPAGKQITPLHREIIRAERRAYERRHGALAWPRRIGVLGLLGLLALGLWGYLNAYYPRVAENPVRGGALTGLLLVCQALAVLGAHAVPAWLIPVSLFPTLLVTTVAAIAYDQRLALATGVLHALLVIVSLDLGPGSQLALFAGAGAVAAQLDEVRSRSKLLVTGVLTGTAMALALGLTGLAERALHVTGQWQRLGAETLQTLLTGVATGFVVQGLLPLIERLFKVSTSMTLRELNDASHPLLRRLAEKAPGTYQHSLRIADMSEAAAEAIGAKGLLCRVGAMYHDIGKTNKPQYFIENQQDGHNRHAKLSPTMSHLVIVGHVKDGVEMAREYGLPPDLRQFIETHHGTTLVEYFYDAAKRNRDASRAPEPQEVEFRYPGPKPRTKEAAILMLCDSVESAARSLGETTPVRIDQLVRGMARKRLDDGQFDESNLTLQELNRIVETLIKTLRVIYHARIKYPGQNEATGSSAGQAVSGKR